jgi:hypothetical protein
MAPAKIIDPTEQAYQVVLTFTLNRTQREAIGAGAGALDDATIARSLVTYVTVNAAMIPYLTIGVGVPAPPGGMRQ